MAIKAQRVDTWTASLKDKPGGLVSELSVLANLAAKVKGKRILSAIHLRETFSLLGIRT